MMHLEPHIRESRCQELRSSPFWPTPLFKSQLVKDGQEFLLKKAPLKILRVLDPIKTSHFMVPTIRNEAPTENVPMGDNPPKAATNHFAQVEENQTIEVSESFSTSLKGTRAWKPLLPMTSQ